jgi:hypothetical protein
VRAISRLVATSFLVLASDAFALALLLSVMSGAALAQITGTVNPSPAQPEPSMKGDVPPGGCMPIGLTESGEIVFPIQCWELIERQRGKAVEQNPAAVEEKPAAKQSEAVAPGVSNPVIKPDETVPLPKKRVEHAPRVSTLNPTIQDPALTRAMTVSAVLADERFKSTRVRHAKCGILPSPLCRAIAAGKPLLSDDGRGFR